MATRSPTETHSFWGAFASEAVLPNVSTSPTQSATLEVGDRAYVPGVGVLVCIVATPGSAVWIVVGPTSLPGVTDLDNSNYYTLGSNPLTTTNWTMAVMLALKSYAPDDGTTRRYVMGTRNNAPGGAALFVGTADLRFIGYTVIDSGAVDQNVQRLLTADGAGLSFMSSKVMLLTIRFDNGTIEGRINGSEFNTSFGAAGAITAGGNLTVGATAEGTVIAGNPGAEAGLVHGAAYALRTITDVELGDLVEAAMDQSRMVDIPGGGGSWTAGWRVGNTAPGAVWTPFVGAGNLTLAGATSFGAIRNPQWR